MVRPGLQPDALRHRIAELNPAAGHKQNGPAKNRK
jgi:hypothetical protein